MPGLAAGAMMVSSVAGADRAARAAAGTRCPDRPFNSSRLFPALPESPVPRRRRGASLRRAFKQSDCWIHLSREPDDIKI